MSPPGRCVALSKCHPYGIEPCTSYTAVHSPPTILHCAIQRPVTPAVLVWDYAAVVGWRLVEKNLSDGEKRRLKRVCPFSLSWPLLKRHPHCQPSLTRYKNRTHSSWHLILTKARVLARPTRARDL
jgi:hypothetical protein